MLVAQDLIFTYTYLDLPLTASFVENRISLGLQIFSIVFFCLEDLFDVLAHLKPFGFGFPVLDNHIFDTVCKCYAMFPSCMIMHEWNVHVLNPFFIYSFLLSNFATFLIRLYFTSQLFRLALFLPHVVLGKHLDPNAFLSRHIPISENNVIWFSHCRNYKVPFFYYFIIFSALDFSLDFRVVNKFCIHNEQSLMQYN